MHRESTNTEPLSLHDPAAQSADTGVLVCANCGDVVPKRFCSNCGQEHVSVIVPIRHILTDIADEFLKLDSKIVATLRPLFTQPGLLTNEYIAGRRARYVAPFRLYFIISAIYFLAFAHSSFDTTVMEGISTEIGWVHPAHVHVVPQPAGVANPMGSLHGTSHTHSSMANASDDRAQHHLTAVAQTVSWIVHNQSLLMFLLVPVAAGMLALLYLPSRRLYVEHLVF